MKKLFIIVLIALTYSSYSQEWTMYPRHRDVKVKFCCDDRHEFEECLLYFDIDTSYDVRYNSKYDWSFWGAFPTSDTAKTMIYRDFNEKFVWSFDCLKSVWKKDEFYRYYTMSQDSIFMPYVLNMNNYANAPISASATLNFPSTLGQGNADLTITLTGAVLGDPVSLGIPNGSIMSNSSYISWVSATNIVTVRFNNYDVSSKDPASGVFKVSIIK